MEDDAEIAQMANALGINIAVTPEITSQVSDTILPSINLDDPQVKNHKMQFEEWLNKSYENKKTSFILKKIDVDHIICVIKGINKIESAQQRYRFRAKNWSIVNGKLYQTKVIEGDKNKKICLPVAWLEDFFVLLYDSNYS